MIVPALVPVMVILYGASLVQIGLAVTVFNIVSVFVQTPIGALTDRGSPIKLLCVAIILGALSLVSMALIPSYLWLLMVMGLLGLANGVYHPADYSILTNNIDPTRLGSAFSWHTFSGYLGTAVAPAIMLSLAGLVGTKAAIALAGIAGLLIAGWLWVDRGEFSIGRTAATKKSADGLATETALLSPKIILLTAFFALLSLNTSGIQLYATTALVDSFHLDLVQASSALTAFLSASAVGVLAGGRLADRTKRHDLVASIAVAIAGGVLFAVIWLEVVPAILTIGFGISGFLLGIIAPSRDMMVRAAAPKGKEGQVFGIVTTGLNLGGVLGPLAYGWIMDSFPSRTLFWATCACMAATVILTALQARLATSNANSGRLG